MSMFGSKTEEKKIIKDLALPEKNGLFWFFKITAFSDLQTQDYI